MFVRPGRRFWKWSGLVVGSLSTGFAIAAIIAVFAGADPVGAFVPFYYLVVLLIVPSILFIAVLGYSGWAASVVARFLHRRIAHT